MILVATAIAELACIVTSNRVVDSIGGLPLVLVLPGAAVVTAIDPSVSRLHGFERAVWYVLGSMALSVLGGLVLNLAGELTRGSWLILIALVVYGCPFLRWISARVSMQAPTSVAGGVSGLPAHVRTSVGWAQGDPTPHREPRHSPVVGAGGVAILVGAVLLVGASLTVSQLSTARTREHFAELWMVPAPLTGGSAATSAEVGVRNLEGHDEVFTVQLFEEGDAPVHEWSFTLRDGAVWSVATVRRPAVALRATLKASSPSDATIRTVTLGASG